MINIEELKKLKELLDNEIITQEEFDKKKSELLSENITTEQTEKEKENLEMPEEPKKTKNKRGLKMVFLIAGILVVLCAAFFAGKKYIENRKRADQIVKRTAALETAIKPIMDKYGLNIYKVKPDIRDTVVEYDVYAEKFDSLNALDALDCLKELDKVSIMDPCGKGKIGLGLGFGDFVRVHPGLDVEYSYWRVSSSTVLMNKINGGLYKTPGIYWNKYKTNEYAAGECIFEYEN